MFSLWHFLHPRQRPCPQIDQLCPPGGAAKLLAVQRRSVGLVNVKSRHFDVVQASVSDPVALTFDVARGLFFWADNLGNIYKSDGQQSSALFSGLLPFVFREKFCFCFWSFFSIKTMCFLPCRFLTFYRWTWHHRSGLRLAHWKLVLGQSEDGVHLHAGSWWEQLCDSAEQIHPPIRLGAPSCGEVCFIFRCHAGFCIINFIYNNF